ncbi:MAG: hypothetical protein HN764_01790 [Gammaproteobacteria bacterium]|jgi:hypothetical protein|nr:hypothetical protein [Gammaproteobacteria bacterium]
MKKEAPPAEKEPESYLSKSLGHTLTRFIFAGFVAFFITFALLFFMRYLILGYDKFTSEEITRYLSIKTIITSSNNIDLPPIERPIKLSIRPDMSDPDLQHTLEASPAQQEIQISIDENISQEIEDNIEKPELQPASLSIQEKLKLMKQEILSEDD